MVPPAGVSMAHSYQTMAETAAAVPSIRLCPTTDKTVNHGGESGLWLGRRRCGVDVAACQRWARRHSPHAHPVLWMGINGICCLASFLLLLDLLVYDKGPKKQMKYGLPLYAAWNFGTCAIWCVESAVELLSSSSSSWQHGGSGRSSKHNPSSRSSSRPHQQQSHNETTDHHQQQQRGNHHLCELFVHVILLLAAVYFLVSSFLLIETLRTVTRDEMEFNTWDVIISFVLYLLAVMYNAATWWYSSGGRHRNHQEDDGRGGGEDDDDDNNSIRPRDDDNANPGAPLLLYQSYQLV